MDLEQLNKTQIILLTLLVSFVTSIATGIVTVSLVNQAPPGITQTVSRIVERTVETIVPDSSANQGASVITTTETVIVKDDDAASQSIEKIQKSIVRIYPKGVEGAAMLARGVVVDAKGVAITDRAALQGGISFEAEVSSGVRVPVTVRAPEEGSAFLILDLNLSQASTTKLVAAPIANAELKLGQTVIRLGGKTRDAVAEGVVSALPDGHEGRGSYLEASVDSTVPGSVLITLFGEVAGITTTDSMTLGPELYATSGALKAALAAPAR